MGEGLGGPSRRLAAAPGWERSSSGRVPQVGLGEERVGGAVGGPHPLGHRGGDGVGEPVADIPQLVERQRWTTGWSNTWVTARRRALAPSITTSSGRVTSSPRSRRPTSRSPTTVAFSVAPSASPNGTLVPSMVMPSATTPAVLGHSDAVHHEGDQVQPGEVGGQQLGQGMLGSGHEPAENRRLGGARRGLLNADPDWFQAGRVAAGGQLGQHSLQCQLIQQLGRGERLVVGTGSFQVPSAERTQGRTDPYAAAAEGHLARLAACRTAARAGLWRPLGPTNRATSSSSMAWSTCRPVPTASASSTSRAALASSATDQGHLLGQLELSTVSNGGAVGILRHGGPLRRAWRMPDTYHTAGLRRDRHLNFYGNQDNLSSYGYSYMRARAPWRLSASFRIAHESQRCAGRRRHTEPG